LGLLDRISARRSDSEPVAFQPPAPDVDPVFATKALRKFLSCLTAREAPVLIDLGIALVAGSQDGLARIGTPPYMAPEQKGQGVVDGRADIYALGQMVAEIFGGKLPPRLAFGSFGQRPQDMPPALGKLVRLMLKEDPNQRLGDLKIIAETLRTESLPQAQTTS